MYVLCSSHQAVILCTLQIKKEQLDIIGFQEVRFDSTTGRNQVSDLQKLLPEYQWLYVSKANDVMQKDNAIHNGWEGEGNGL